MDLEKQILSILAETPGLKAHKIASKLSCEKKKINSLLYGRLKRKVWQDKVYKWYLIETKSQISKKQDSEETKKDTELAKLCRYYLECLSYDADQGISAFAQNKYGQPDYVELSSMPVVDTNYDWLNVYEVGGFLGKIRREHGRLTMYIGYPTRLRYHKTAKWKGFFVEPLFLFQVDIPVDQPGASIEISSDQPFINFRALKHLTAGGSSNLLEEAVELADALGLNNPQEDLPEVDELFSRLREVRPEWDWRENIDPSCISSDNSLAEIEAQGIYNRPIVALAERSPYTQGLETELKKLFELDANTYTNTALGRWIKGQVETTELTEKNPLIEVLPLNLEQREAVNRALDLPLTVITGPPGTGKSQVVTALLVNAAWSGQKVLFASKNNKAVDVVEVRVNGLGSRPILLRLGSNEYQGRLVSYLTGLLGATSTPDDKASYEENLANHESLTREFKELQKQIEATMSARNTVDRLDRKISKLREKVPRKAFLAWRKANVDHLKLHYNQLDLVINRSIKTNQGFFTKLFWSIISKKRFKELKSVRDSIPEAFKTLFLKPPQQGPNDMYLDQWVNLLRSYEKRLIVIEKIKAYFDALDILKNQASFEVLAKKQMELNEKTASNALRLWQDWIKLQPDRLVAGDRQLIANYASILQMIVDSRSSKQKLPKSVYAEYYKLLPKISHLMPCWAVTSLSASGKVPFEREIFDLLVIDEASQCDIASALPLLFRTKRAVIIGDPKQLPHISTLSASRDAQLQDKYGIVEGRAAWMYSVIPSALHCEELSHDD